MNLKNMCNFTKRNTGIQGLLFPPLVAGEELEDFCLSIYVLCEVMDVDAGNAI